MGSDRRPARRPVALTGTPGTGKSSVAAHLPDVRSIEVGALAADWGMARGPAAHRMVDLPAMIARARRPDAFGDVELVVGHLAHLLPLRRAVVLRCRPDVLADRLRRAHRGTAVDRKANEVAEAVDTVALEAYGPGRRVAQIDTTGRTIPAVAREVRARLVRWRSTPPTRFRWLADPRVTDHLLGPPR